MYQLTYAESIIRDRLILSGWSREEATAAAIKCGDELGPINQHEDWLQDE